MKAVSYIIPLCKWDGNSSGGNDYTFRIQNLDLILNGFLASQRGIDLNVILIEQSLNGLFYYLERIVIEPPPGPPPMSGMWIADPVFDHFNFKTPEPKDEPFAVITVDAHQECPIYDGHGECNFTHHVTFLGSQEAAEALFDTIGDSNRYLVQVLKKIESI